VNTCRTLLLLTLAVLPLRAQPAPRQLTAADYARAESFLGSNADRLVLRAGVRPSWLPNTDRFWYRVSVSIPERAGAQPGAEFILVDPRSRTRQPLFDHIKLAAALASAVGDNVKYDATHLPFQELELSPDAQSITVSAGGKRWKCDTAGAACAEAAPGGARAGAGGPGGRRGAPRSDAPSPDGKLTVLIKDWNLWLRDVATGKETQLTTDGVKDYGYATDNAGWKDSNRPIVLWSPDSKKIATFQQDQRKTGDMYLVETRAGHPRLRAWKYPLPGDADVTMIERVIIDVEERKLVRLKMPPDQHRSTLCDDISCRGGDLADAEWSPNSRRLAFVSSSRDHKQVNLRVADAASGEIGEVLQETAATQFESGWAGVNWRFLPRSNEFIWFTEASGWGHLYLHDLATGKRKNAVTSGDWVVTEVLKVDQEERVIFFKAGGREKGRDPYFQHLYRVGFDGRNLALLTPEDANHDVTLSPSGQFFVDVYSKPDAAPVAVLRDRSGKPVLELEKADISHLQKAGWKPPIPIRVKARDGETDLYGLMFQPTKIEPGRKYPIVDYIYPGPQGGSVGSRSFSAARSDHQALAELGFIVVAIDGMGNPLRSKKFHDFYYANLGDNTLPDQIAGMRQLAAKYPYIDIERAGIWGGSGGGFATADALFRYPDFFKVGVAMSGNHDNRLYEDDWGERYHGLLTKNEKGETNYDDQANQNHAKNLKGKLLLAHGTMDNNVPPYNTLLVVDALIKANKDFDLLLLPNRGHGIGSEPYMMRRRWDYFVRWLAGAEPPREYELKPPQR
jgi:dipeptidyl aminopeptidase/acylaminoacyl peptidase